MARSSEGPSAPMGSEIMKGLKRPIPDPVPREMTEADYVEWARRIASPGFPGMSVSVAVCRKAFLAIGGEMTEELAARNPDGMQRAIREKLAEGNAPASEPEDPPADDED